MSDLALAKYDPHQPLDSGNASFHYENQGRRAFETAKIFTRDIRYPTPGILGNYLQLVTQEAAHTTTPVQKDDHAGKGLAGKGLSTAIQAIELTYLPPAIFPRGVYASQPRFISLQKWECAVEEIKEDSFVARLVDLTSHGPNEEAEFSFEEVPITDLPLLKRGAVFYWNIGYSDSISGQRTRVSVVRFRRLPVWKTEELDAAKREAVRLGEKIGWK